MFLVTKKSGGKRPVLNLKPLNKFAPNQTFKMEGIHLLKDFLKPNYFMTKLDLSDAYYSVPIDKHSRRYLQPIILPSPNKIITTYSSDFGWGIWSGGDHSQGLWSGEETRWHINLKELMAGFIGLKFM